MSHYQVYAGGVPARDWSNWQTKIATAAQVLVRRTGERARWERLRDQLFAQMQRPDFFYCCTIIVVSGRVP